MEVTEVKIFPVQEDRLKAYVAITFDRCFVVRDLKVINGNNGLFVAMPSKKRKDGTYRDTAHPLNNETRQMIESVVLAEYYKEVQKSSSPIGNVQNLNVK
jgi:stage V sporulation protein G